MHIASAHNHPRGFCSPPSGKNFEMLGLEFEEYEIIFEEDEIGKIRNNVNGYFDLIYGNLNLELERGYWYK